MFIASDITYDTRKSIVNARRCAQNESSIKLKKGNFFKVKMCSKS